MIKVEHQIDNEKGLVKFAFQASGMEDYAALDLLREALETHPNARVGFYDTKRLIAQFKGIIAVGQMPSTPKKD